MAQKIRFRLLTDFKTNLQQIPIQGESIWKVSKFASLFQKNGFAFVDQIWHYNALNQYSMAQKIVLRLGRLHDNFIGIFKMGRSSSESLKVCLIFPGKCFVFMEKIWYFQALYQYSIVQVIRFTLSQEFKTSLQETPIRGKCFQKNSRFTWFSQKNGFLFVDQIIHL